MSETKIVLFKIQIKLNKTVVEFEYINKKIQVIAYDSSKLETLVEKILKEIKVEKKEIKFVNNDTSIIPELYYPLFPVKLLINGGTLKKIIIKNEEYSVQIIRENNNKSENEEKTTFIMIDEQDDCRLHINKGFKNNSSLQSSNSEEKIHVVSVFGSTHSGKSRIIYELLSSNNFENTNSILPFVGLEEELSSTTNDIHIYERNTVNENEIKKIFFLDVEGNYNYKDK
jgi:hypothetical protein